LAPTKISRKSHWHPTRKTSGKCGSIIEKEGETKTKSDIDASKFKISNSQTYKLTEIFRKGIEPHSNIKLCPM
jgi:hypothetical protein